MKLWYKDESFRVLPNIEITKAEEDRTWWLSLCWMKIVVGFKIGI